MSAAMPVGGAIAAPRSFGPILPSETPPATRAGAPPAALADEPRLEAAAQHLLRDLRSRAVDDADGCRERRDRLGDAARRRAPDLQDGRTRSGAGEADASALAPLRRAYAAGHVLYSALI